MSRKQWLSPIVDGRMGFADWVRALRGHSGVYLIRSKQTHTLLYVGESHTNRLFETMTRHFYYWTGYGAGPTYQPSQVEVQVIVATTPLDDPVADQYALIQRLRPRDNILDGRTMFHGAAVKS